METNDTSDEPESDDELEDIEHFIKTPSKCFKYSFNSPACESDSVESIDKQKDKAIRKNLEELLKEFKLESAKEDNLKELKKELWDQIQCRDDSQDSDEKQDLASEHADHIDQLEVRDTKLMSGIPGLTIFHADQCCCLFNEDAKPQDFGFFPSPSATDRYVVEINKDNLEDRLMSDILLIIMPKISYHNKIMLWLWNLMSIHSSLSVVRLIGNLLRDAIQQQSKQKLFVYSNRWCPNSVDLFRLLVNLGASEEEMLESQTFYTIEEIRSLLPVVKDPVEKRNPHLSNEHLVESFSVVLNTLSYCLQTSPLHNRKEISFMFYLLAKTSLHTHFQNFNFFEYEVCLSSLLECYSDFDWPESMADLCKCLPDISSHHRNQAYLLDKIPKNTRGRCLRQRLALIFLHRQLAPAGSAPPDLNFDTLKLTSILNIGSPGKVERKQTPLCNSLQDLVQTDLYKLSSVTSILDLTVGDELQRSELPVPDLQLMISEIKAVIKTIRDNMNDLDYSKVKEGLTCLTIKWSLTLQDNKSKQKTIFNWMTASPHKPVHPVVLKDKRCLDTDDDD